MPCMNFGASMEIHTRPKLADYGKNKKAPGFPGAFPNSVG